MPAVIIMPAKSPMLTDLRHACRLLVRVPGTGRIYSPGTKMSGRSSVLKFSSGVVYTLDDFHNWFINAA